VPAKFGSFITMHEEICDEHVRLQL
jgi:hypothetical protein